MNENTNLDSVNESIPSYIVRQLKIRHHHSALVIPIINEGQRILMQLERISKVNPNVDVIIADGGSTDGTLENLTNPKYEVTAILMITGPGKLSAQLRMAFDFCLQQGYQNIITMDGNNKDGPEGIQHLVHALDSGFDFVQGSRFIEGGKSANTPWSRSLAIKLIHAPITSFSSGFRFTDTTNGSRCHSRRLLECRNVSIFREVFRTYELISYIPISAARNGYRVCEVPVERNYPTDGEIPTKIRGISGQLKILKFLLLSALGSYSPKS